MFGYVLKNDGPKCKSIKWLLSTPLSEVVLANYSLPFTFTSDTFYLSL